MSQLALVLECETQFISSRLSLIFAPAAGKQTIRLLPIPEPKEGYVQVRIEAAAINPLEYKIYDFAHSFIEKYPTVLGVDAAGEVTKLGPGDTKFKVGDRVMGLCTPNSREGVGSGERGAFQQYTLADVRFTAKIPANIDYDSAASFPVAANTAAGALYGQLKFTEPWLDGGEGAHNGEKIVILGGSSSVGCYAIQLAVLSGFEVTTTSSLAHFAYLQSLGATTVIDRSASDAAEQILGATGAPVKYVVDAISSVSTQLLGVDIVQPKGTIALVLNPQAPAQAAADAKEITLSRGQYFSPGFWNSVESYVGRGVLRLNRTTVLLGGLKAWEEGFDLHRKGRVSGTKIVMRPLDTNLDQVVTSVL
ncbi:chaperonin 10-like protein [Mycena metata]|uniref:Chaperonin 10-like protein n=1 Tax=Mycena metata TaxID=1033252 RepID=A0AAD7NTF7_9AGAR|nr:chaperonin 10-like protein [Mycena metata]